MKFQVSNGTTNPANKIKDMIPLEVSRGKLNLYVSRIFLVYHTRDLLNVNLFKTFEADVNSNKIKKDNYSTSVRHDALQ